MTVRRLWLVPIVLVAVGGLVLAGSLTLTDDETIQGADKMPVVEVDLRPPARLPQLPKSASEPTEAGATTFALFWFDTLNYSLANATTDQLASYTTASCRQCTGYLIGIERWKSSGATLEGGLTVPLNLAAGPFSTVDPVQLAATFLTTPATITQPDGSVADFPGGRTRGGMAVLWSNSRWQMADIVLDVKQAEETPP